jgi:PAS domain S-box-containing protein
MNTAAMLQHNSSSANDTLERALHILQDAIIILNRKAEITYINRAGQTAIEKQVGAKPSVGDNFFDFANKGRKQLTEEYLEEAFSNQPVTMALNYPQNGIDTWFEVGYYPMPDESGAVSHVCVRAKDITEKVKLQQKLESEREKQKNRLIKAALDAQEKQRTEIGRELHDNVNQVLTTVKLYNEICLTEELTNKKLLLRSVQQINYCIETLRSLSKTLSSPAIEEMDLKDSIKELVDEVNATRRVTAKYFTYGIEKEKISQDLQTTLYRIAQEQLTNVLKYANASVVDVMLVGTANSIALKIQDDGVGFDPQQRRNGVGITNMVSRSETLNGTIELVSSPGQGCALMAEFPV